MNRIRRVVLALAAVCALAWPAWPQALLTFPDGALAGDVTDSRAVVWGRVSGGAAVRVEYGPFASLGQRTEPVRAEPASDFAVKVDLSGLHPGSRYYYRMSAEAGERRTNTLAGSFKTAPASSEASEVSFVWGGDTSERFQPFRIYDAMRARQPDFFLFLGDTIYADIDGNAQTLEDYRAAYRRNRDDEPFRRFARTTSIYAIWDDHEVFNKFRPDGAEAAGRPSGIPGVLASAPGAVRSRAVVPLVPLGTTAGAIHPRHPAVPFTQI